MSAAPIGDGVKKVVYTGPAQQVNHDVGAACGDARLEPGREYELPADLVDRLCASSPWWKRVKTASPSKPKAKE